MLFKRIYLGTETLSPADLELDGLTVSRLPHETETKEVGGKPYEVPKGIDPGFEYNPGRASFGEFLSKFDKPGKWTILPDQKTAADYGLGAILELAGKIRRVPVADKAAAKKILVNSLGGETWQGNIGGLPVTVNADYLLDHLKDDRWTFLPNIKILLESPSAEKWLTFYKNEKGKVALRMTILGKFEDKGGILVLETEKGDPKRVYFFPGRKKGET